LLDGGRPGDQGEGLLGGDGGHQGVSGEGGEIVEKGSEAVDREAILGSASGLLGDGGGGARGFGDDAGVLRFGGIPTNRLRLDFSRIQIDVWGTSKSEARDIAAEARAVVHAMEGESFTITGGWPDDAFVTAVADDLGLLWLPDPDTARDRYTFGVALTLHAL